MSSLLHLLSNKSPMIWTRLQIQLQYVKMGTSDRAAFHLVDIQALGKSVNTSVNVPARNVITSKDVIT